ncbi:murein biosynthesis integral membrane protein MurJ [Rhodobacteraceae bacterium NNCM2]|nr:murein biosynthesis integral membrane protein MurJ [Coraliihabitans acroporae]
MNASPIRIMRGFATVGGWTMASRILGFVRDVMIAALLGSGPVAEAFFVAFRLPNMFRRFFAEGAFNMAFIPLFSKRLEAEGAEAAKRFADEALSALLTALILLTLLAQLAMPWFVWALASGFEAGEERTELAIAFSRVCFPYIIFISLAALFSGILNAFGKFAAAAAAPVLLNVVLISGMALSTATGWATGWTLVWAVFVGGICQMLLVMQAVRRLGLSLSLRWPRLTPGVRRLIALGIPAALAGGVMQINLLVGTQIASWTEGAIGWLWYADRVYQLPLGLVGVAIGIVLLPDLSRRVQAGDLHGAAGSMNRAAEFALALTLPATVALIAVPELITATLFQRGAFDAADSANTATALWIYALGLPAFVLQRVLQPAFMAREDMKTPLKYAVISMIVNVALALALLPAIGWVGTAVGTTAAGWAMLVMLWRGGRKLSDTIRIDDRLRYRAGRMLAASLLMGAAVLATDMALASNTAWPDWARLCLIVPLGAVCYTVCASLLGAFQPRELKAAFKKGA